MVDAVVANGGAEYVRFAEGEGYAPRYLARKHRISVQQARDLLAEVGTDRERLNLVAAIVRAAAAG